MSLHNSVRSRKLMQVIDLPAGFMRRLLRILASFVSIVLFYLAIPDSDWRSDPRLWGALILMVAAGLLAVLVWEKWLVSRTPTQLHDPDRDEP
jgi:hypothetical protein